MKGIARENCCHLLVWKGRYSVEPEIGKLAEDLQLCPGTEVDNCVNFYVELKDLIFKLQCLHHVFTD